LAHTESITLSTTLRSTSVRVVFKPRICHMAKQLHVGVMGDRRTFSKLANQSQGWVGKCSYSFWKIAKSW